MFYYPFYPLYDYRYSYPPVNVSKFQESLKSSSSLLQEATILVENLEKSPENMQRLMEAAQASQDKEVDKIINQASGDVNVETSYTPSSVTFTLTGEQPPCCRLKLNLRWG